ncbi:hypothetical protein DM50_3353 [Burkholderia mallei]|nr:hypothetical protein DM50_3353 [Burkholderia mallei]
MRRKRQGTPGRCGPMRADVGRPGQASVTIRSGLGQSSVRTRRPPRAPRPPRRIDVRRTNASRPRAQGRARAARRAGGYFFVDDNVPFGFVNQLFALTTSVLALVSSVLSELLLIVNVPPNRLNVPSIRLSPP